MAILNLTEIHMEKLGLDADIIQQKKEGVVLCSTFFGASPLIPQVQDKLNQLQKTYEKSMDFFHVVLSYIDGCETVNFLCCPKQLEEDEFSTEFLENGFVCAYCWNLTIPEFSEFGDIRVECKNGLLSRIA